jgi:hypothetical protein
MQDTYDNLANSTPFAHSRLDSKNFQFIPFYASYFPWKGLARTMEKNSKYDHNFLIICRYLKLVKNQRIIL